MKSKFRAEHLCSILPLALTLAASTQALAGANLISCEQNSGSMWFSRCVLNSHPTASMQELESTFVFHYDFPCTPGGEKWLRIGVAQPNSATSYFKFGKSGTLTVVGRGPFTVTDDLPEKTRTISVKDGCRLEIQQVDIAPTPIAVASALSSAKDAAEGWAAAVTIASTNHAAFLAFKDAEFCTLIDDYDRLSDLFGAHHDLSIILSEGGNPARQILSTAVKAANDNGAFDLAGVEPITFLQANKDTILARRDSCGVMAATNPVPTKASCRNVGVCKSNVDAYESATKHLTLILDSAARLRALSARTDENSWVETDRILLK